MGTFFRFIMEIKETLPSRQSIKVYDAEIRGPTKGKTLLSDYP